MTNQKYEITDIAHEKYPFLHRIRALRDIGTEVKAGDLGGFVEHEGNLSFEPGDDAYLRGVTMFGSARASGASMILALPNDPDRAPVLSGHCCVYGKVTGSVKVLGDAVIISSEQVCNDSLDTIMLDGKSRTVFRDSARDVLHPRQPEAAEEKKPKRREQSS